MAVFPGLRVRTQEMLFVAAAASTLGRGWGSGSCGRLPLAIGGLLPARHDHFNNKMSAPWTRMGALRGGNEMAGDTDPAKLVTPPAIKPRHSTIVLFDVDGTLTAPRQRVTGEVLRMLSELRDHVTVGVVGGSDLAKIRDQLTDEGLAVMDYVFAENGLVALHQMETIGRVSLASALGEKQLQRLVNWCLGYLSTVELPIKRGTFIEYRSGMINVSPIGRNCSPEERNDFEAFDKKHGVRSKMITALQAALPDLGLTCSVGGQISFDVMPTGWDKTFCLHYLPPSLFPSVFFFGDKTQPGGNDHEIFHHPRVKGHAVQTPQDTMRLCQQLFIPK